MGRLPQVGTVIGKGIREFRKATRGEFDDEKEVKPKADTDKKQVES